MGNGSHFKLKNIMKALKINAKYAVVQFQKAELENYNPSVVFESDSIDKCEDFECDEEPTIGFTVVENIDGEFTDYYTGELFEMKTYN